MRGSHATEWGDLRHMAQFVGMFCSMVQDVPLQCSTRDLVPAGPEGDTFGLACFRCEVAALVGT